MMSILFKSCSLGLLCNLEGTEKQDLYQTVSNKYECGLDTAIKIMTFILEQKLELTWQKLIALIDKARAITQWVLTL
jgi:hypothetical protein